MWWGFEAFLSLSLQAEWLGNALKEVCKPEVLVLRGTCCLRRVIWSHLTFVTV